MFYIVLSHNKFLYVVVKAENVGRAPILVLFPTLIGSIFIYAFTMRELERRCRIIFVSLIGVTFIYIHIYIYIYICMLSLLEDSKMMLQQAFLSSTFFFLLFYCVFTIDCNNACAILAPGLLVGWVIRKGILSVFMGACFETPFLYISAYRRG